MTDSVSSQQLFSTAQAVSLMLIGLFGIFMLTVFGFGFNFIFFICIALVGFVASVIWPTAGITTSLVLTLVFAKYFSLQPIVLGQAVYKLYPVDILLMGSYLGLILRLLKGKLQWHFKTADILLAIFMVGVLLYFIFSIVSWGGDFAAAFSSFKNYTFYPLLFYAVFLAFDSSKKVLELRRVCFWSVITIIGFLIYGVLNGQGLWTEITPLSTEGSRLLDFDHAFYLSLTVMVSLVIQGYSKRKQTAWFWLTPIYIFGIIASLMRHLWLAGLVAALYLLWQSKGVIKNNLKKIGGGYLLLSLSLLLIILFGANTFPDNSVSQQVISWQSGLVNRVSSFSNSEDTSFSWRTSVWSAVWQDYQERALVGVGFGQKVFIEMPDFLDYVENRNVHNSFLAILTQTGIFMFLLFIAFIANVFLNLRRQAGDVVLKNALSTMIVFCLVAFMFQPYLEANFFNIFFWTILGLSRRFYEGFTS